MFGAAPDESEPVAPEERAASPLARSPLELVLDRVRDAVSALDRDDRFTYVNAQAARLLGRPAEALLGKNIWELFPDALNLPFGPAYRHALAAQEPACVEIYDAPWAQWIESRIYPSQDGSSIFFHDISERKRADALLAGQSRILEMITHGSALGTVLEALLALIESQCPGTRGSILLLDRDGICLHHGASPSLPDSFTRVIDGSAIGPREGSCGTAAFLGQPVMTEDIALDPSWERWRELALQVGLRACWSTPIFEDKGRVLGTFAMYYAVPTKRREQDQSVVALATHVAAVAITHERAQTERREQERVRAKNVELEESKRAALQASRLKSEFLASMSHELRTPLNAIIGFSELLSDGIGGELSRKQHEYVGHVLVGGKHLLQLINDVLDLARIESGKLELHPVEFELQAELEDVCSVARALAKKKSITVSLRCAPDVDRVTLDPQKLRQVLFNLLGNAVRFTGQGGLIEVEARAVQPDELEIRVLDTGIGIRPEDMPKLFQEFSQISSAAGAHGDEGTGLGLVLAKRLVESQGGQIAVESSPGRGSTFSIVLPRVLRPGC